MTSVVIIGMNEGKYVDQIIQSLPQDWKIYYVADRCTDNTLEKLGKYENVYPIDTTSHKFEGRKTSTCRNLGLSCCPKDDDILFLDGDRYIVQGNIKNEIENTRSDILLLTLETDDIRSKEGYDFSKCYGYIINGFYSCGIWFKREAIRKVQNQPYMNGQFFPEFLQELWGVEDTTLGDICYDLGLTAEICKGIRLRGYFEKMEFDNLDPIEQRFSFRQNLSTVKWGIWEDRAEKSIKEK